MGRESEVTYPPVFKAVATRPSASQHEAGDHRALAGGGPHEPEFDRWVVRDLACIDRWSLFQDLKVLLRAIPAVIGRTGK
jgi:lipopolysaccharide/colanic/teichoic acid biosynthesis glycosyltransferase